MLGLFILSIQSISVKPIGLTTRQCRPLSPHGSFGRLSTIQFELRVKNSILILTMEFPARKYTAQLNCRRPNNSPKEIQHFYPTQPGPALMFLLQNFIFSGLIWSLFKWDYCSVSQISHCFFFKHLIRSTWLEQQVLDLDKGEEWSDVCFISFSNY